MQTRHSYSGFAVNGFAVSGFAVSGFAVSGFAVSGFAVSGFAVSGFAVSGFAVRGFAVSGFAVRGLAVNGFAVNGVATNGFAVSGFAVSDFALKDFASGLVLLAMMAFFAAARLVINDFFCTIISLLQHISAPGPNPLQFACSVALVGCTSKAPAKLHASTSPAIAFDFEQLADFSSLVVSSREPKNFQTY